jgi:hypothetical protein
LAQKKDNTTGSSPSELKTALDKSFKVWCKMRNMSRSLALKIESSKLQLILGSADGDE